MGTPANTPKKSDDTDRNLQGNCMYARRGTAFQTNSERCSDIKSESTNKTAKTITTLLRESVTTLKMPFFLAFFTINTKKSVNERKRARSCPAPR